MLAELGPPEIRDSGTPPSVSHTEAGRWVGVGWGWAGGGQGSGKTWPPQRRLEGVQQSLLMVISLPFLLLSSS